MKEDKPPPGVYRFGAKPLVRHAADASGEKWFGVGLTMLQDLYRRSAPVLVSTLHADAGIEIRVEKLVHQDRILVSGSGIGYVVALRHGFTGRQGPTQPTGEAFTPKRYETYFYRTLLLKNDFRLTDVSRPSTFYDSYQIAIPWAGKLLDAVAGLTTSVSIQMGVSRNLGDAFETELQYADNLTQAYGNQAQPMLIGNRRGFWFIQVAQGILKIGTYFENAETAGVYRFPKAYAFILPHFAEVPSLALSLPDRCLGFLNDHANPVNFFIATKGGEDITYHRDNEVVRVIDIERATSPTTGNFDNGLEVVKLMALTQDVVLVHAYRAYVDFSGHLYRINLVDGTSRHVLGGLDATLLWANMGKGVIVVLEPVRPVIDEQGRFTGARGLRHVSFDNGRNFTTTKGVWPQSTLDGATTTAYPDLGRLTVIAPYLNDENQGAIYMPVWQQWGVGETYGNGDVGSTFALTDVRLFKSTDLMQTWQFVSTVIKQDDLPRDQFDFETADLGLSYPEEAVLVAIGSPGAGLPIDVATPWRCDASQLPPDWWSTDEVPL